MSFPKGHDDQDLGHIGNHAQRASCDEEKSNEEKSKEQSRIWQSRTLMTPMTMMSTMKEREMNLHHIFNFM